MSDIRDWHLPPAAPPRPDGTHPIQYSTDRKVTSDTSASSGDEDASTCQWCGSLTIRNRKFPGFKVVCCNCLRKHYATMAAIMGPRSSAAAHHWSLSAYDFWLLKQGYTKDDNGVLQVFTGDTTAFRDHWRPPDASDSSAN